MNENKKENKLTPEQLRLRRIESFKRLANNRVNRAIKAIQLVCNLSNKSHYQYTDKQSKQIIQALFAQKTYAT